MEPNSRTSQNSYQELKEDNLDLKKIFFRLIGSWPYLLVSLLLALTIAFFINRYAKTIYKVEATVLVDKDQKGGLESLLSSSGFGNPRLEFENEMVIINSKSLCQRTIDKLPFEISFGGEGRVKSTEIFPNPSGWAIEYDSNHTQPIGSFQVIPEGPNAFRIQISEDQIIRLHNFNDVNSRFPKKSIQPVDLTLGLNEWLERDWIKIKIIPKPGGIITNEPIKITWRTKEDLVNQYYKRVNVRPASDGSAAISLSLQSSVPEKASAYINTLISEYQNFGLEAKNLTSENAFNFISGEINILQDSLNQVESVLEKFQSENQAVNISERGEQLFTEVFSIEKDLI